MSKFQIDNSFSESQAGFIGKVLAFNKNYEAGSGRKRLALVHTYGCQQNVSDSEKLMGMLAEMGYGFTENPDEADLVLFNTCAVREHAELRVFGNVGALKIQKKRDPSMIIGLCGCMMQQQHIADKIKKNYPYVDLVFGTHVIQKFPELLCRAMTSSKRVVDIEDSEGVIAEGLPVRREGGIKAWLPVMYGCNNFCSYCIVPYVRGRERSRLPETILSEARALVNEGYKDITLLGQNVNSYGRDLDGGYPFARLLREINAIDGDFRIRFMTSHPKDATDELFDAMAECEKVSKHLHLPFQAGSDRVLRAMNRGYTKEQYIALARKAKEKIPGLVLTSDIIVGFPGETYEEFLETIDVIKRVGFDSLYTFIYSKRKGTPAEKLDDPVSHEEKVKWFQQLLEAQEKIGQKKLDAYIGKTLRILVEDKGKSQGRLTGRTDGNIIVDVKGPEAIIGSFINVKITSATNLILIGENAEEE